MDATALDHVNLYIPDDGVDEAVAYYSDTLGFDIENLDRFESGEKPFISVRITPESIIHLQPTANFHPPRQTNFNHVAIVFDHTIDELRGFLSERAVKIDRQIEPLGATGTAPAVYVTDPFGYTLELKVQANQGTKATD